MKENSVRIKIEIVDDITIIKSFNEKGYLKIYNVGDETNLQTTLDNKEVVKVINEINAKVHNGSILPLIEQG